MWLILALTGAIGLGLQSVYLKKNTLHFNEYIVTWSILAFSALLYLPILIHVGFPHLNKLFWLAVGGRVIIDSVGLTFYVKGLKIAPLSLATPMVSLIPLLIIIPSFFINHLLPNTLGLIGIFITVFGIYFLNFDHDTKHLLSPFFAIKNNRGLQYVLIFVLSQAFVVSFQKLGIDNSNVYFYTSFFQLFWAICFLPFVFFVNPKEFLSIFTFTNLRRLFPVGGLDAVQVLAQNIAYSFTLPVYVQSVQNTSILFSSLFGWWFFKEKIQKHIFPTIIIVIGIILITLAQK